MTIPRFWREIPIRYNLVGSKCPLCGTVFFPPKEICKICRRVSIDQMIPEKLSGRGTILTHTTVHEAPTDFESQVPYHLAIIELDEGPSVLGQITDCTNGDLAIGSRVRSVFRRVSEDGVSGTIHYGYKFVLDHSR